MVVGLTVGFFCFELHVRPLITIKGTGYNVLRNTVRLGYQHVTGNFAGTPRKVGYWVAQLCRVRNGLGGLLGILLLVWVVVVAVVAVSQFLERKLFEGLAIESVSKYFVLFLVTRPTLANHSRQLFRRRKMGCLTTHRPARVNDWVGPSSDFVTKIVAWFANRCKFSFFAMHLAEWFVTVWVTCLKVDRQSLIHSVRAAFLLKNDYSRCPVCGGALDPEVALSVRNRLRLRSNYLLWRIECFLNHFYYLNERFKLSNFTGPSILEF